MKIEKFNISISREILIIDKKGRLSKLAFPRNFREDNKFIRKTDNNYLLKIQTSPEASVKEAYEKFEEITNVVTEVLYNRNELIWPSCEYEYDDEKIKPHAKIKFSFGKEFLSDQSEDIYAKIEEFINSNREVLENIYGKIRVSVSSSSVSVSNIKLCGSTRFGISEKNILAMVAIFFQAVFGEKNDDLFKSLEKIDKKYNLKAEEAIRQIKYEAKTKLECNKTFDDKLAMAEKYMLEGYSMRYTIVGHEDLAAESKVLIKDSITQGIDYKVLNDKKSVVEHGSKKHKEIVIEGNKTDRDSYIFPIITDDKYIAKSIMQKAGVNVPDAILLDKSMTDKDKDELLHDYYNTKIVVKPRNTNYGTGITVFSKPASKKLIFNAIEYAFQFDDSILIEQYVKGMEYRFLVIDGKCVSIVHRRNASVVGDGKSTIKELIKAKNKEPWHALTGAPVKMEKPVEEFLKLQELTYGSIIPKGERVTLRTNSNCSTGGESVDYTDVIPTKFKKVAEKAAKAFDAKICGVDIIIDDLEKDNYSIIEINDNPGYSINEWPYEGRGEKIGIMILKLLDLI